MIAEQVRAADRWLRLLAGLLAVAGPAPVALDEPVPTGSRSDPDRLTLKHDATSAGPRLLGPADVRSLAAVLDLRPTKQRGQNFVIDANTVRRIVRESGITPTTWCSRSGPASAR